MQLRAVRVTEKSVNLYMQANLDQWLILAGMTLEEFREKYDADVFQLVKAINFLINAGGGENDVKEKAPDTEG